MTDEKHEHPVLAAAADETVDGDDAGGGALSVADVLAWRAWFGERQTHSRRHARGRPTGANPLNFTGSPLPDDWMEHLGSQFEQPYMRALSDFLRGEREAERGDGVLRICPRPQNIFRAFELTPLSEVKAVIIGQDPYHGPGQAMGLSFSVPTGIPIPPSLRNILKEQMQDVGVVYPDAGDLTPWARQGVLLLNSALTVSAGQAGSHSKRGWQQFTDEAITAISRERQGVVFLLWGSYARQKATLVNRDHHHVLEASHPSPLSAHNGFFGCRHFSKTNELLADFGRAPVEWQLPSRDLSR